MNIILFKKFRVFIIQNVELLLDFYIVLSFKVYFVQSRKKYYLFSCPCPMLLFKQFIKFHTLISQFKLQISPNIHFFIDGRMEEVHIDKITSRIKKLCYGLNNDFVDPVSIIIIIKLVQNKKCFIF